MKFNVVKDIEEIINDDEVYLIHTAWDDWFQYNTKYRVYLKQKGDIVKLGEAKIAEHGLKSGAPSLPKIFDSLNDNFYSLGTDSEYYKNILEILGSDLDRNNFFRSLRDVAADEILYEKIKDTEPFTV